MFKELNLKATYSSYEDDIATEFYIPTLKTSKKYDRATAYFSAKALASYAKGMEAFGKKGNYCRLIVSEQVSKDDFEQIKKGYELRNSINQEMLSQLKEELSLEEERNISNLAYLISLGIIDVKIAFTEEGIFHDKFGIMEDEIGDIICFRGSNNETAAAFNFNYEAFDITCSWQTSEFDYAKITKCKEVFEKLWTDTEKKIAVRDIDDVVLNEILSYNRGQIIVDKTQLEKDCFLLDYDTELKLEMKTDSSILLNNRIYKLRLKRYIDSQRSNDNVLRFKSHYTYVAFKKIINMLEIDSKKRNYRFFVTDRLKRFISEKELFIDKRARIGLAIKNRDEIVRKQYEDYKEIVDKEFERKLREKQMWDSFFMFTMKKCSNFSVPGSGKTASALGVYAYLHKKGLVKRIVMIGPINSFNSWIDEFKACFGGKQELSVFSIQNSTLHSTADKRRAIAFNTGGSNLILFNYESIGSFISEIEKLVSKDTLLIFDEIHKIKAIGGVRATYALEIARKASYIIAMTGTPIPNSYTDIRNLLEILFHDEYDDFFGFSMQQLKNPEEQDIQVINKKLQPFFCRTTKKQLLVPEANGDAIIVINASEQENKLFNILRLKYSKNKLALIIRLLQLESNPSLLLETLDISEFADILDISKDIDQIDYVDFSEDVFNLVKEISVTKKFEKCISLAKNLLMSRKKIIIWCIFKDSMSRLNKSLSALSYSSEVICGETDKNDRQEIITKFKSGEIDCLITNPHTLAESVSLHNICHDAIYFEYSYNLVHLLQSKDRIHRLGLPDGQYTQYYFLEEQYVTNDGEPFSLDEKIYDRLREKEQIMLDAIENNVLEKGSTTQEDLDIIFKDIIDDTHSK